MTKTIKITLISLAASIVASAIAMKADGFLGIMNVELPSFNGTTTLSGSNSVVDKVRDHIGQSYESMGTTATFGGDAVNVQVRTKNVDKSMTSLYLTLAKNELKTWAATTQNANHYAGRYTLEFKTEKSLVWGAKHSGIWYYDEVKY